MILTAIVRGVIMPINILMKCSLCRKVVERGEVYFMVGKRIKGEMRKGLTEIPICELCYSNKDVSQIVGCQSERPTRKTLCQLPKGHKGSHQAMIYWEE